MAVGTHRTHILARVNDALMVRATERFEVMDLYVPLPEVAVSVCETHPADSAGGPMNTDTLLTSGRIAFRPYRLDLDALALGIAQNLVDLVAFLPGRLC